MAVVPSLLVWLVLSTTVQPVAGAGSGYVPTGSLDDLVDLGVLARLRDPRIRPIAIGPNGTTRLQGRTTSVDEPRPLGPGGLIAEIAGPGIVQRIALIGPERPAEGQRSRGHGCVLVLRAAWSGPGRTPNDVRDT